MRWFFYGQELFDRQIVKFLDRVGGPLPAQGINVRRVSETEVRPQFVVASIAAAAGDLAQLPPAATPIKGLHPHLGPDGRAAGHRADEFNREPGIAVGVVAEEIIAPTVTSDCEKVQET